MYDERYSEGTGSGVSIENGKKICRIYDLNRGAEGEFVLDRELILLENAYEDVSDCYPIDFGGKTLWFQEREYTRETGQMQPVDHGPIVTEEDLRALRLRLLSTDSPWVEFLTGERGDESDDHEIAAETELVVTLRAEPFSQPHPLQEDGEILPLSFLPTATLTETYTQYRYGGESLPCTDIKNEIFVTVTDSRGKVIQKIFV